MTFRTLRLLSIILPTVLIGGFEFFRHKVLISYLSMEAGNVYITIMTLILSYLYANWMFNTIQKMNDKIATEQTKRAVYEDRERMARELHDNIAQTLFFLNVKLKQGKVDDAQTAVKEIDQNLRQAIFNLRTRPDDGSSLKTRIHSWISEWNTVSGIEVNENIHIHDGYFSPSQEILLFSIIQEAFTNIRKHSSAMIADISLFTNARGWILTIKDNGSGIKLENKPQKSVGLTLLEEQVKKLDAILAIQSLPSEGTELVIKGEKKK